MVSSTISMVGKDMDLNREDMVDNKSCNIKKLIKEFQNGDKAALEKLMLLTYKNLFLLAYGYLKDKMLAEDVVSETFLQLIKKVNTIKNEKNLNGYLHTIIINKSLDLIRKRKREIYFDDNVSSALVADVGSERLTVCAALSILDSNEREVLLLWNYGYTLNEISAKKNFTVNQVRLLLDKAKKSFFEKYHKNKAVESL